MRELAEEVGLTNAPAPEFFGLYTRKVGWASNLIASYRVRGGRVNFKLNPEIGAILFADPADPPQGLTDATARRLAELRGAAPTPYW